MSSVSQSIKQGLNEALSHARGQHTNVRTHKVSIPDTIDVKAIRHKLRLTRAEFAAQYGFSIRTLEKWEQGVRRPEGAARAYLLVIDRAPEAVKSALKQ